MKQCELPKRRRTPSGSLQHIYKITTDGGVLFYRDIDHLVYYSIQSVMARKHNLPVQCSCHMFTHTHDIAAPVDPSQLIAYERDVNAAFSQSYNMETGRSGQLFRRPFGSAPKRTDKDKRSSIIYVFNNPVEKRLCHRAIEDRWTFLAYYEQEYPFSEKPRLSYARWPFRNAVHMIDVEFRAGRWLKYPLLFNLFSQLNAEEKEQLTDFIIQRYFFFDRETCYDLFKGVDGMISAIDLTQGKEFDVGETFDPHSDIAYREMCSVARKYGLLNPGLPLLSLPETRKVSLAEYLSRTTSAEEYQIRRFLHLEERGKRAV